MGLCGSKVAEADASPNVPTAQLPRGRAVVPPQDEKSKTHARNLSDEAAASEVEDTSIVASSTEKPLKPLTVDTRVDSAFDLDPPIGTAVSASSKVLPERTASLAPSVHSKRSTARSRSSHSEKEAEKAATEPTRTPTTPAVAAPSSTEEATPEVVPEAAPESAAAPVIVTLPPTPAAEKPLEESTPSEKPKKAMPPIPTILTTNLPTPPSQPSTPTLASPGTVSTLHSSSSPVTPSLANMPSGPTPATARISRVTTAPIQSAEREEKLEKRKSHRISRFLSTKTKRQSMAPVSEPAQSAEDKRKYFEQVMSSPGMRAGSTTPPKSPAIIEEDDESAFDKELGPKVEGRKWQNDADNDSLFCY